jgi:pantetheine-phosphate adenylyltransferase
MIRALVPGSFDPVTNGHLEIIARASGLFGDVRVVVARNSAKTPLFSVEERVEMLTQVCAPYANVTVDAFEGLLVNYAAAHGATVIVKGLRFVSDFEAEMQQAQMNRRLNSAIETVFLITGAETSSLSSSIVKEIARLGGAVEGLVPNIVRQALSAKFAPT